MKIDYESKLRDLTVDPLWPRLDRASRRTVEAMAWRYRLSHQEFRRLVAAARDLRMWGEKPLARWWREYRGSPGRRAVFAKADRGGARSGSPAGGAPRDKKGFLRDFGAWFDAVQGAEKVYRRRLLPGRRRRRPRIELERSEKAIHGLCPVASPDTLCCRLRTIDAVESCPFGCTYCTIQTFYGDRAVFDADFARKLAAIRVDPREFARFGSGQSSDSLVWGNRYGVLSELLGFAAAHPNILLELKSKSDRVGCLLRHGAPRNVVCSWSLNPDTIVRAEEHGTPVLRKRLRAARRVADRGIPVAFHFHPMIYYSGWREEYEAVGRRVMELFRPEEVLFISFGSVTLIKPVIRALRMRGGRTRILQMSMARDPKGKLTYPDSVKIALFRHMRGVFSPWHEEVYFYLCMEKRAIWEAVFGFAYGSNREFERDFGGRTLGRITAAGNGAGT